MAAPQTTYTEERADTVVALLAQGRRPATCAAAIGVCRATLYLWRSDNPDFALRWDQAVATATDRVEEAIYESAVNGNTDDGRWWLKHNRPHPYNPDLLLKARILQASLAAQAQGRDGRVVLDPDSFALMAPEAIAARSRGAVVEGRSVRAMPLDGSKPDQVPMVMILPSNGREELPPAVGSDGSGRRLPLPKRCVAIVEPQTSAVVKLTADGKLVPAAAMLDYWRRIQAIVEYANLTGEPEPRRRTPFGFIDPDTNPHGFPSNGAAEPEWADPAPEPDPEA
jgi:hypothetical protein